MKILFLDMDGVLNDHSHNLSNHYCGIKSECVENLNLILKTIPNLYLVISSAWRYIVLKGAMTVKGFEYLLLVSGVDCKDKVIGITSSDEEINSRGGQIRVWLNENKHRVSRYVILDDMKFNFNELKLTFHQTNGMVGLTKKDAELVIKKFL
jgi:hypothetical protein